MPKTAEAHVWIPIPPPFAELLDPKRYKVYHGGRGGGKSWAIARALLIKALEARRRIICAREFQVSIRESVHALLETQIRLLELDDYFEIQERAIKGKNGSEFLFMGLKQNIHSAKSFEGADILWIEEGQTTSKQSLEIIIPTIRKEGSEIWITLNIETDDDPVKTRFIDRPDPDVLVRKVNYDQNPYMSATLETERQRDFARIDDSPSDEARAQAQADYDHVWGGFPRRMTGAMILKRWIVKEFDTPPNARLLFGADWGFANDPTAIIRAFIHEDCLYVEYEAGGVGVELDDLSTLFDSVPGVRSWPIKADSARPETISYMARQGFRISAAEKWPGSVEDGIAHLNAFKRIVIHPRCRRFAEEARLYSYKVDRMTGDILPIIVDANNHGVDALRYSLDGHIKKHGSLGTWEKLGKP